MFIPRMKIIWGIIEQTYSELIDDKAFKMAAALSYYAAFSLGPMLIIVIAIAGFFFGEEAARGGVINEIKGLIGYEGAQMIETIIKGAANKSQGILATIFGIIFLILGAIGVFVEMQESLNIIWGVELKPGRGIWGFVKTRLISFAMVVAFSFLLLTSLVVNSVITALNEYFSYVFSPYIDLAQILNIIGSFLIVTLLFGLIFKILPDIVIPWKYVWLGAGITAVLFSVGKYLIGLYLGSSSYSSTYGGAASLVIIFIWIYYSGLILFFGAEFTQVYFKKFSQKELKPDADSIIVPKISELIKESINKNH